ncbi:MAG: flotillin family protein [Polyangiaceae bacterium]|nr:flotillin family protein [Polyangiaceae bacterium]
MMIELAVALGVTALVVVIFIVFTLNRLLLVSPPNKVLILAGGRHQLRDKVVGYRAIRGGRAVRVPLLERATSMDISNIPIEIAVKGAYSKGGIPLNVQGVAHVKLPGEEPRLSNAAERFLGRSRAEIAQVARETLEGNVRGVLALLTPEQVNEDKMAFENSLLEEAEHDMVRIGLVLDTLKIQNVTDDANYLNSIGRIRGARIKQSAAVAEARARSEAQQQKAENWAQSEIAKIETDLAIARQETDKRIKDALSRREAMIQEARGKVLAEIAKVEEDIKRQSARAPQVERQLEADVVQPWEAERRKLEEEARAAAATIVERGRAEAAALKSVVTEYRAAGGHARDVLVLQQLVPLLTAISGADKKTRIAEWTVLPTAGDGGALAQQAISATEQLRAATGIDLARVARRLSGEAEPPPAPAPKPARAEAAPSVTPEPAAPRAPRDKESQPPPGAPKKK